MDNVSSGEMMILKKQMQKECTSHHLHAQSTKENMKPYLHIFKNPGFKIKSLVEKMHFIFIKDIFKYIK